MKKASNSSQKLNFLHRDGSYDGDPHNHQNLKGVFQQNPSTTVSLRLNHDVAAGTAREFSDDCPGQIVAQGGDGIGHVALRASGCRAACNLGVGKVVLSEWSFFWSRHV